MTELEKYFKLNNQVQTWQNLYIGNSKFFEQQEAFKRITSNLYNRKELLNLNKSTFQALNLIRTSLIAQTAEYKSDLLRMRAAIEVTQTIYGRNFEAYRSLKSASLLPNVNQLYPAQIDNLYSAMNKLTSQLAVFGVRHGNLNLVNELDEINTDVISINEKVLKDNGITKSELEELKILLKNVENKVSNIDNTSDKILKILTVIGFLLAIVGEVRNWLPKPEYATRQEIKSMLIENLIKYENDLNNSKEIRIINCSCKVMLRPNKNSFILNRLNMNHKVTLLMVNHKWVYVRYVSPNDNLPHTGWILKKYLH